MAMYYLDIETTGVDPRRSQILTIQYQEVGPGGRPRGELHVLKSWESDEREVLSMFHDTTRFFDERRPWAFFPTGFNLGFEYRFLIDRMRRNQMEPGVSWDFALQKPSLDLQPVAILMNGGAFKGASLENFSPKPTSGHRVIEAIKTQDWPAVEAYIDAETAAFFDLLQRLHEVMPELWHNQLQPTFQQAASDAGVVAQTVEGGTSVPKPQLKSPWRSPSN
jgi:hypothetical protein